MVSAIENLGATRPLNIGTAIRIAPLLYNYFFPLYLYFYKLYANNHHHGYKSIANITIGISGNLIIIINIMQLIHIPMQHSAVAFYLFKV
jgi:hypothetical protein